MSWLQHRRLRTAVPTLASCAMHVVLAVPLALHAGVRAPERTAVELDIVTEQAPQPAPTPTPTPPPPPPPPAPGARAIRPPTSGTMAIAAPKRRGGNPDGSADGPLTVGEEAEEQPTLSGIRITKAWYGWNSPGCEPVDRTSFLAEACNDQSHCHFTVSNGTLGGDPCPDLPKGLQVLWDCLDAFGAPHPQDTKGVEPSLEGGQRISFHCP